MRHCHLAEYGKVLKASGVSPKRIFRACFTKSTWLVACLSLLMSLNASSLRGQVQTQTGGLSDAGWSVQKLKTVQTAIRSVAKKNTDACVGIDDGYGVGSGVIVSRDGLILTAAHVMSTNRLVYEIFFSDGTTAKARRLGRNKDVDAGMLQLEGNRDWPFVELGSSDSLKKGDWVVSLGHSGGFELGRNPPVRSGRFLSRKNHQIVTDAVLIGGDSGGPLFDLEGRLIAIHSSIGDAVSINRHAKIEQFKLDWDRLRRGETWGQLLDLSVEPPVGKAKMGVKLDLTSGRAKIKLIKPRSAAAKIGLAPNDIVIGLDGEIITDAQHLIRAVKSHVPGDTCFVTVLRNDQTLLFEIRLD